jgi:hypothetical protein
MTSVRYLSVATTQSAVRRALPYLVLTACSVLYLYPFMRLLMHGTDEGTLIYAAERVAEGQVPFRDFFEVMGPGTFYWLALFFKIFGTTWFATRVSVILTSVATIMLMYYLSRRLQTGFEIVPPILFIATSFGLLWPSISHHADSNLFALLSFAALLSWSDNRRNWMLFLAGVGAGLTTCFLQPKGTLLFLSFLAVLWCLSREERKFRSSVAWLSAGYAAVGLCVLTLFGAAGALPDLFMANVVWPLTRYGNTNSIPYATGLVAFYWARWTTPLISQFGTVLGCTAGGVLIVPHLFIAALPLLLVALVFRRRREAFSRLTAPYWIVGSAIWLSEIHRRDIMHLVYGSPLLVILFFYLYRQLRSRWTIQTLQLLTLCTIALAGFNGLIVLTAQTKTVTRRGVVRTFGDDPVLGFLHARTKPGEEIFVYPFGPMYYFLAAVNNPTRYSFLTYDLNTDEQFLEVVRRLEERKVRYVIWDTILENEGVKWAYPPNWAFRRKNQIVEPYLLEHYNLLSSTNGVRILERKKPTAEQVSPAGLASH